MSRVLPYDCDALLPIAERYASLRFRRVAQRISLRQLDFVDLVELVAFIEAVGGIRYARYILHWRDPAVVRLYRRHIVPHVGDAAKKCVSENLSAMGVDAGLAVLRAMREGGWKGYRTLPKCVKDALKQLRKDGNSIAAIGRATGLSREQVKTACDVRRGRGAERSAAFSSLALG